MFRTRSADAASDSCRINLLESQIRPFSTWALQCFWCGSVPLHDEIHFTEGFGLAYRHHCFSDLLRRSRFSCFAHHEIDQDPDCRSRHGRSRRRTEDHTSHGCRSRRSCDPPDGQSSSGGYQDRSSFQRSQVRPLSSHWREVHAIFIAISPPADIGSVTWFLALSISHRIMLLKLVT